MCMVEYGDNPCLFLSDRYKHARHRKQCSECSVWIPPGDLYSDVVGAWRENGFQAFSICSWCDIRRKWLLDHCGCYGFGEIVTDFESHFELPDPPEGEDWPDHQALGLEVIFETLGCLVKGEVNGN